MNKNDLIKQKILTGELLIARLQKWRDKGSSIVFTNGCFDMIHAGHIDYLSRASELGDILLIGLNTDDSVKRLKGEDRPVYDEMSRAMMLASFFFVSAVTFFSQDTPYELIKKVQPDVLVKGSDYKAEEIVGYDIVKEKKGKIITMDYLPGYSTSLLIKKIRGKG
ncbi:MAG: D-glycero-beta-D-manno-heptose 1-phosphate adenylyltransferase [Bacteroidota bacterium]